MHCLFTNKPGQHRAFFFAIKNQSHMLLTTPLFAERMNCIPESFIREILKVATEPEMISFAGGLPNPAMFPAEKMAIAAEKVIRLEGKQALQYAPTEGYLPLRDYIARRQSTREKITITAEDVLILNGSQQGLDLSAKLFCNKGQQILLEEPSYLGAIQAFSAYEPSFNTVSLYDDGPDETEFNNAIRRSRPAFFYCIPNFQNPTGRSYSIPKRLQLMESQYFNDMIWIEDDPYGEIGFRHEGAPSFHSLIPGKTLYLGSFSKTVSPGMRLGWATGPTEIIRKLKIAKQASDLHSSNLGQRILYQYLLDHSLDDHLWTITSFYAEQASYMETLMKQHFPPEAEWSTPAGGMFIWVTLPENVHSRELLNLAIKQQVLFVPGDSFFLNPARGKNTLRLNFSNPSRLEMEIGIERLGALIKILL
jgi:2-aminoadipate transaminase